MIEVLVIVVLWLVGFWATAVLSWWLVGICAWIKDRLVNRKPWRRMTIRDHEVYYFGVPKKHAQHVIDRSRQP